MFYAYFLILLNSLFHHDRLKLLYSIKKAFTMRLRILLPNLGCLALILSACSADMSDTDRVIAFAEKAKEVQLLSAESLAQKYAQSIITKLEPEPYFNPDKPIPDYYALSLDSIGINYPKDQVYRSDDYWFYKNSPTIDKHQDHNHEH